MSTEKPTADMTSLYSYLVNSSFALEKDASDVKSIRPSLYRHKTNSIGTLSSPWRSNMCNEVGYYEY